MILQTSLPYDPLAPRPLPGIAPLEMADWLGVDEAYHGQMAERDRLIATQRDAVIALDHSAQDAASELLDEVVRALLPKKGFSLEAGVILRPDGGAVRIDRDDPMGTIGRLAQEDFCILQKQGEEHVLTGAVLCFPASWSLDEKFMKPLVAVHAPVSEYDGNIARRVQRLFDGVQADRPLWRFNALWYADPALHQPRRENARRDEPFAASADFMRSELQTVRRLPDTGAVVFAIHTFVVARGALEGQG